MGAVMKLATERAAGRADGKALSAAVERRSSQLIPTMVSAIIVAAGSSRRMGFDKLFAPLAGKPVLWHSLKAFSDCRGGR